MRGLSLSVIAAAIGVTAYAVLKPSSLSAQGTCLCFNGCTPVTGDPELEVCVGVKKIYSPSEIAGFAQGAGFDENNILDAIAIAIAESGGNANAYNPEVKAGTPSGKGSYGLWQVYEKAHPEFDGLDLTDPQTNAIAAFHVYTQAGRSFRPWSTFKNGAYQAHLSAAEDGYNTFAGNRPPTDLLTCCSSCCSGGQG